MQVEISCSIRPRMQKSKGNGTHTDGKKVKLLTLFLKKSILYLPKHCSMSDYGSILPRLLIYIHFIYVYHTFAHISLS